MSNLPENPDLHLADAAPAPEPPPAAPAPPAVDRPCPQCGYNLRDLPETCRCPGCHLEITRKTRFREELPCAEPAWILILARGAAAFLAAMLLLLAHIVFDTLQQFNVLPPRLHLLPPTLALGYCVALPLGIFLLTTRERRTLLREPSLSARLLARLLTLLVFPVEAAAFVLAGAAQAPAPLVGLILIAIVALRTWLVAYFLQQLARRIPDDSLQAQTLNFGWFASIALLLYAAASTIATISAAAAAGRAAATGPNVQIFCVGVPNVFFFVLMAWGAYLAYRFTTGLFYAVHAAERMATPSAEEIARASTRRPPAA